MAVMEFEINGGKVLEDVFEKLPAKYSDAIVISTMRKAARPLVKAIRSNAPKAGGGMARRVKTKATKRKKGCPSVKVGWAVKNDGDIEDYFKAYWLSYGTLANRASNHTFKFARKGKTMGRKGGIKPLFIVEKAWAQEKDRCRSIINNEMESIAIKYLKKRAIK